MVPFDLPLYAVGASLLLLLFARLADGLVGLLRSLWVQTLVALLLHYLYEYRASPEARQLLLDDADRARAALAALWERWQARGALY